MGIGAVASDGAAVEDVVPLPPHLDALAKVLQALRLAVHGASAGGCPTHAPAPHIDSHAVAWHILWHMPPSIHLHTMLCSSYLFTLEAHPTELGGNSR